VSAACRHIERGFAACRGQARQRRPHIRYVGEDMTLAVAGALAVELFLGLTLNDIHL
jgi:hypothetical protein